MLKHIMRFVIGLILCALLAFFIWLMSLETFLMYIVIILLIAFIYMVGTFIDWILEMRDY